MALPFPKRWLTLAAAIAAGGALAIPAAASADLVAAYDHSVKNNGLDIALLNASTGHNIPLPAGVNTSANESHPSLTADGSRLVFQRGNQVVDFPLRGGGPPVTTSPIGGSPPVVTPSISPDGKRVMTARGTLLSNGRSTGTSGQRGVVNISSGIAGEFPAPLSAPLAALGGGTADPSIANGDNPIMAWSSSRVVNGKATWDIDMLQFSQPHFQGTLRRINGIPGSDTHAYLQADARFGAVNFVDVPIRSDGSYGPGDLGTIFGNAGISKYPSGSPSDPTKINTPEDERASSFSGDGNYMGFLRRRASDGHVLLEVFHNPSNKLVNLGYDLGFDADSNARRVNTGLSIALDPTIFHVVCNGTQCLPSNAGPLPH
jgi:hypothetical protein